MIGICGRCGHNTIVGCTGNKSCNGYYSTYVVECSLPYTPFYMDKFPSIEDIVIWYNDEVSAGRTPTNVEIYFVTSPEELVEDSLYHFRIHDFRKINNEEKLQLLGI